MELLKAINKLNKLKEDVDKLENWINYVSTNDKPVHGLSFLKVQRAVNKVIDELVEESLELEEKVKKAAEGIKVDHK